MTGASPTLPLLGLVASVTVVDEMVLVTKEVAETMTGQSPCWSTGLAAGLDQPVSSPEPGQEKVKDIRDEKE